MNARSGLLFAYRQLLQLYPCSFKERFGAEMLEIAQAASLREWPFIFSDTGAAIIRSWLAGTETSAESVPADGYVQLATFPVKPLKLFEGFALATALVLAASLLSTQTVWNLPSCHVDNSCAPTVTQVLRQGGSR
jgi:hypothetical protein